MIWKTLGMKQQEVVPFHNGNTCPPSPLLNMDFCCLFYVLGKELRSCFSLAFLLSFLLFPEQSHKAIDFIFFLQSSSPPPTLLNFQLVKQLPDAVVFLILASLFLKRNLAISCFYSERRLLQCPCSASVRYFQTFTVLPKSCNFFKKSLRNFLANDHQILCAWQDRYSWEYMEPVYSQPFCAPVFSAPSVLNQPWADGAWGAALVAPELCSGFGLLQHPPKLFLLLLNR